MTEADPHLGQIAELAQVPELNPGPVCRLDRDGRVLLANGAARRLFGEGVVGSSWVGLWPGMDQAAWDAVLAGGPTVSVEAEVGDACLLFTHVRPEGADSVYVFGADITRLRQAERHAAEMARFPEMNPGPVLRMEPDATVVLANAAARRVFGEGLVGARWLDLCPALDADRWAAVLVADEPVTFEARVGGNDYLFVHRRDPLGELVFAFGSDVTQQRHAEQALRQSERMATLGTLAAGVAHELNNPAAATRRAADQLADAFDRLEQAHLALATLALDPEARARLDDLAGLARKAARQPSGLDALERSDREAEVEDWLDGYGVEEPWDVAPALVALGLDPAALEDLTDELGEDAAPVVLAWAAAAYPVYTLAHEIGQGAGRISEIVGALKSYSYLGQAPLKALDLHAGLDDTLIIMRNKLKKGITVRREYADDLPPVPAYGGELNQVWTNLIDNAVDAVGGQGHITIRTRREGAWACVAIEDDGPGIPPDVLPRIFDAFYTTKEPGRGTGLGLSTSYSIVVDRHRGSIAAESAPGSTVFTVRLPIDG